MSPTVSVFPEENFMIRKTRLAFALAIAALAASPVACFAFNPVTTKAAIDAELNKDYPHLDALYKDIHEHPELGFQETRTAALLAKQMRALGFTVTEHVGKTGIVAIYKNGPGPTVLVRTELDALPVQEKTGVPYASTAKQLWQGKETYVDHACGHDIHMATWVGTAEALLSMKNQWHGTLMFIGQPSEEAAMDGVSGAKAMLNDGLFTRFPKPDFGFALHNGPMPFGVYYRAGTLTSNSTDLFITFHGKGSHGSMPQESIDPVMMAARFIVDVQDVISREKDPAAFGVITIGSINAGSVGNVIPDTAVLRGTIRSYDPAVREKLFAGITRTAQAEAAMSGAPAPDVDMHSGVNYSAVVNDTALTERTAAVFKAAFGDKAHAVPAPMSGSEDYSEFINAGVPSLYFMVGAYDPQRVAEAKRKGETLPVNHSPLYAPVPEPTIRTGVEAMTLAVMNAMQPKA
jgi:amidohydrolase